MKVFLTAVICSIQISAISYTTHKTTTDAKQSANNNTTDTVARQNTTNTIVTTIRLQNESVVFSRDEVIPSTNKPAQKNVVPAVK